MKEDMHAASGSVRRLADVDLAERTLALARQGRGTTAALVTHLAELDARDLHLRQGYSSLFVYCREALALSEHDAYRIVAAAHAARRFPVILAMLEEGSLNLTTVKLLAPCLTVENHREVLERARGMRRSQVEEMVAMLVPEPDAPPTLERLLSPEVAPLAGDRYRLQLTVGGETVEKMRLARDMLRHAVPAGDEAAILERALAALLTDLAKKKFAATDRPRAPREASPDGRHVPAEVKREVWLRDLGRCAFVGTEGRRCGEARSLRRLSFNVLAMTAC
jgi:hypothetical protein